MSLTVSEQIRYSRQILLKEVGISGQENLKNARVLVIGAGGIGCPALQYLAAAGIGTLGIIDFDQVDESNLQRQILFSTFTIGEFKSTAAKNRLQEINPLIKIIAYTEKLTPKNALIFFNEYDIVLDGSDNFATRYLVNDASVITETPLIYGSIYRFEGQVSVFNYKQGPSYRCLFPDPPAENSVPNCSQIGVMGVLPGIIGTHLANEALKIILGIGQPLSGKLMIINTLNNQNKIIKLQRSNDQIEKVKRRKYDFEKQDYQLYCNTTIKAKEIKGISVAELKSRISKGDDFQFIDVRETHELPKVTELNGICLPADSIVKQDKKIDHTLPVIIYCQSGIRSKIAIKLLQDKFGYKNLLNLEGGVENWMVGT